MENVIAPPAGNVSRRRAPDGRKLLLIFGNRINSTLVKYFKEGRWSCVHKLALGMAPKCVPRNDSLNPRGNAHKFHQCFDLKRENVLSFNACSILSPHSY